MLVKFPMFPLVLMGLALWHAGASGHWERGTSGQRVHAIVFQLVRSWFLDILFLCFFSTTSYSRENHTTFEKYIVSKYWKKSGLCYIQLLGAVCFRKCPAFPCLWIWDMDVDRFWHCGSSLILTWVLTRLLCGETHKASLLLALAVTDWCLRQPNSWSKPPSEMARFMSLIIYWESFECLSY